MAGAIGWAQRLAAAAVQRLPWRLSRDSPLGRPHQRSAASHLVTVLARSLDDGTPEGTETSKSFTRLSGIVTRILASEYHALAVQMQADYEALDPTGPPPPSCSTSSDGAEADVASSGERAAPQPPTGGWGVGGASDAAAGRRFSEELHRLLHEAGFVLSSADASGLAEARHFGDEAIWHLPVTMSWTELSGSLVKPEKGGFDPYEAEAAAGRAIHRPSWSNKLAIYHRGVGWAEKRGYFVVPKIEEMAWRRLRDASEAASAAADRLMLRLRRLLTGARDTGLGPILRWRLRQAAAMRRLQDARTQPAGDSGTAHPMAEGGRPGGEVGCGGLDLRSPGVARDADAAARAVAETGALATVAHDVVAAARSMVSPPPPPKPPAADARMPITVGTLPLSFLSLFEQSVLTAPTYGHVLLAYRHKDLRHAASRNPNHIALALFRDVPQFDLELLLPHQQVQMPPLQRAQFIAFSALGALAGWPLLYHETLSKTGLLTMYTLAALAARTAIRWRSSKQLYQQLLVSYQSSSRLGSSDGALLYVLQMAEAEQTKRTLLALHTLAALRLRTHGRAASLPEAHVGARGRAVLEHWSELAPLGIRLHTPDEGACKHLLRLGLAVVDAPGLRSAARDADGDAAEAAGGALRLRLRPMDEALSIATKYWQSIGDGSLAETEARAAERVWARDQKEQEARRQQLETKRPRTPEREREMLEHEERWC